MTQTNAARLHYFAEKDRLGWLMCFPDSWGLSAIISVICGRHWGVICADRLSTLACYSPADSADYAEECSGAALFRRERQVGMVMRFCGLSA